MFYVKKRSIADDETRLRVLLQDQNIYLIFSVTLMAVLGVSSVSPTFPLVIDKLKIASESVGLLVTVFSLPGVVLTLPLGILADRYGRKRILVPALLLFGFAGGVCALSRSFESLILWRFFQGIGAAALASINMTIIGDLYRGRQRLAVIGYNSSVLSVGTAIYPALGGALAMLGWYYPFALPLIAVPLGIWALFSLRIPDPANHESLGDYMRNAGRIVKEPQIMILLVASVVTFTILYGSYLTYLPLYIGYRLECSPLVIGLVISTSSIASGLTSALLSRIGLYLSHRSMIRMGFALYVVSMAVVPWADTVWKLLVPTLLFGTGMGLNVPCIMNLLTGTTPLRYRGAVMAFNGVALRFGQTIGPLVMGICFTLRGYTAVFHTGAALAFVMLLGLLLWQTEPRE